MFIKHQNEQGIIAVLILVEVLVVVVILLVVVTVEVAAAKAAAIVGIVRLSAVADCKGPHRSEPSCVCRRLLTYSRLQK